MKPAFRWLLGISFSVAIVTAHSFGQAPDTYRMYSSRLPPGAIGQRQLKHGRIPAGKIQPVRIIGPGQTLVAPAMDGMFGTLHQTPVELGFEIGHIYRLQLSQIPNLEGVELYPSIEMIGHLTPPPGKERDFPVPIVFAIEDLRIAAQGGLVTRVVYVEDPDHVFAGKHADRDQPYFEVRRGTDPLHVAEDLGRPIAIVRIGSKAPASDAPDYRFTFQSPPIIQYLEHDSQRVE